MDTNANSTSTSQRGRGMWKGPRSGFASGSTNAKQKTSQTEKVLFTFFLFKKNFFL